MSCRKFLVFFLLAFCLVPLLNGCGGGGSGGISISIVDPAPAYKGKTTQALVTSDNAESLARGGLTGASLGYSVGNRTLRKATANATEKDLVLQSIAHAIKQSTRRIDFRNRPQQTRKAAKATGMKVVASATSFVYNGSSGGTASYSLNINDANGTFSGFVSYAGYSSNGVTISGSADLLGSLDSNRDLIRLTVSTNSLSLNNGTYAITLTGVLSWGYNYAASSDSMSLNLVLTDADGKTYWFKDYEAATIYSSGSLTQTVSGRYYDPDSGYVDLTTPTTLLAYYDTSWPAQGVVKFTGRDGSMSRLTFQTRKLSVEADTNGDGVIEWQTQQSTNSQTVLNNPPVAIAGPDQTVTQGTLVTLNGSGSDPDGDPLSYSWTVQSWPQGPRPSLSDSNTATPSFTFDYVGTYALQLAVNDGLAASWSRIVLVTVTAAPPSDPQLLQKKWQYGIYGSCLGRSGILLTDLDGDGTPEIVAGGSNNYFGDNRFWYVLKQNADGSYRQLWHSGPYNAAVVQLASEDLNGDGKKEILVGLSDGNVDVYDGMTFQQLKIFQVTKLAALAVADIDGDGKQEIITSDGIGLYVYASDTATLKWSVANAGGTSIAVGSVDTDPAPEIVITSYGGKGYVIDTVSHAAKWAYSNGFGSEVALGDVDGDGVKEIVGSYGYAKVTIFDARGKTPVWEISTAEYVDSILVADTDGDGVPEILYADGQFREIHVIDGRTRTPKKVLTHEDDGVAGMAVGDVDNDGKLEIVFGAGDWSTGSDRLYVMDLQSGGVKWHSVDTVDMFGRLAVDDLKGDGRYEVVALSAGVWEDQWLQVLDAQTHVPYYLGNISPIISGTPCVATGDVNGDGKTEIVITSNGTVQVFDGANYTLKYKSNQMSYMSTVVVADVDNDGTNEIVAGMGNYLIVLDGSTLQEKWRSVSLNGNPSSIRVADVDGDGHQDIVAAIAGSQLVVYDGVTHVQKLLIQEPATAVEVADVDGDGVLDILAGRNDGRIDFFDGKTFALKKSTFSFGTDTVQDLKVADLDGDGIAELIVARGGMVVVLNGQNQRLRWSSGDLTGGYGNNSYHLQLALRDTDGGGRPELFVGAGFGLYQFQGN